MADGWASDPHMHKMFEHSFYTPSSFRTCTFDAISISRLTDLAWCIAGERAWFFAARHAVPADCYAPILGSDQNLASGRIELMKQHWANVLWLEAPPSGRRGAHSSGRLLAAVLKDEGCLPIEKPEGTDGDWVTHWKPFRMLIGIGSLREWPYHDL